MDDDGDDNDVHKPRRLDDDTVTYLSQLDVQLSSEDLDAEGREILVENVLSEIKLRTASAACDRRTNSIIEKLCYAASLPHLIEIINRCTPYAVFLARNRHSSHILQAILARLCFILKNYGIGNVNEEELKKSVLGFLKLILDEISWLVKELSASHVVRSALCALAGIPIISERKGKGSKHQHSVSLSEPLDTLIKPGKFYIDSKTSFGVPEEFHDCLGEAVVSLVALGAQEIQSMIADPSSCAVLGLLLRVLFSPDIVAGGRDLAERLARTALECPQPNVSTLPLLKANASAVTLFYAMAGDRSGSYFLESVVECCAVPFLLELLHGALMGSAKEYALDGAGNFVLQAVLRRLSAELDRTDSTALEIEVMHVVVEALLKELTAEEIFSDLASTKGGVVLWLLEAARVCKIPEDGDSWAEVVGTALISVWTNKGTSQLSTVLADKLAPKAALDAIAASKIPQKKVNGRLVADKDSAQLLIARLIGSMLKLGGDLTNAIAVPCPAAFKVAEAIFALPLDTLKHIAKSGPLSRAILDTTLDQYTAGCNSASKEKSSAVNASELLKNLSSLSVDLADHFIGQHILKRVFDKSDVKNKESIVSALHEAKDQLSKTKEGRNSLQNVQAELFARKPDEWRALLNKHSAALHMLREIEGSTSRGNMSSGSVTEKPKNRGFEKTISTDLDTSDQASSAVSGAHGSTAGEDEEGAGTGNRKRKRKRPGKKCPESEVEQLPVSSSSVAVVPRISEVRAIAHTSAPLDRATKTSTSTDRNIDMRKIQKLRSGKVTSLTHLSDDIARSYNKTSGK